ncbi:MAG: hypothetical protein ACJ746_27055, partial [Bryobacteraceae bacterium]
GCGKCRGSEEQRSTQPELGDFHLNSHFSCLQGSSQVVNSAQVPANMYHRRLLEPKTKEEQGPQSTTSVG